MKRLLAYTFALMVALVVAGQNRTDSVKVHFRQDDHQFDPSVGDNRAMTDRFVDEVRKAAEAGNLERIVVCSYTSPEGQNQTGKLISQNRCRSISDYLVKNTGINPDLIETLSGGIAWDELRRLVAENPDVPDREKVLDILDNTPKLIYNSAGKVIGSRQNKLLNLNGGKPFFWMYRHLFPELRNAVSVTLSTRQQSLPDSVTTDTESAQDKVATDTILVRGADMFAIKNNLLFDAALMPNLEFEWLINNNWSLAVEGGVAWWSNDSRHKYYQLAYVSPEVRFHIKPRASWQGIYVGLFGGAGLYDLENGGNGARGEGAMAGASFGYLWHLGKHISLEAAIGAGYMFTRYKEYEPRDGHYLYLRTKDINYFGPLKLKVSIVWHFYAPKKTVKVIPAQ